MSHRPGFTFLELLIVTSIIVLLLGMLMPMVSMLQRSAMRNRTQVVLAKTDAALHQFKSEFGIYPYQAHYPDLSGGQSFNDVPNRLYAQLGTPITDANRALVMQDMDAAAAAFAYNWQVTTGTEGPQPSPVTYVVADTPPVPPGWPTPPMAILLNRMAQSRARLAVLSGNLQQRGPTLLTAAGAMASDRSGLLVLAGATCASSATPGWSADYLAGEIDPRNVRGDSLCDAWGHPLIYINQTIPGMRGTTAMVMFVNVAPFDSRFYGLGAQGFDPSTGPAASLIANHRGLLLSNGRIRISATDAGDGQPTPTDPEYFPSLSQPLQSDIRYYCAPGFETEFELWSAGPDGQFAYLRDDPANRDNISVVDSTRGLR